ncbi:MAG: serine/threonine protein kinase [Oscillospiraceae bacterium]|nr:serine/threonine protein kinase [Oscillospiraceae bacterium]
MEVISIVVSILGTASILSLPVWFLKRHIDKKEKLREARDQRMERWMLLTMKTNRATNILVEATAKAVQRIPDAHCNGDMTAALESARKMQKEEKDFIFDQGVEHIFGD